MGRVEGFGSLRPAACNSDSTSSTTWQSVAVDAGDDVRAAAEVDLALLAPLHPLDNFAFLSNSGTKSAVQDVRIDFVLPSKIVTLRTILFGRYNESGSDIFGR